MSSLSLIAIIAVLQLSADPGGPQKVASPGRLLIEEAQATPNHRLKITGRNFGTSIPTVNLDGIHLLVSSSNETQIVVQLPADLPLGTPEAESMHAEAVRIRSDLAWTIRAGSAN